MKVTSTVGFMQVTIMLLSLLKYGSRGCKEKISKNVILPSVIVSGAGNRICTHLNTSSYISTLTIGKIMQSIKMFLIAQHKPSTQKYTNYLTYTNIMMIKTIKQSVCLLY